MTDTLRATFRRVLRLENRRRKVRPGRLERIDDFHSAVLDADRVVTVYLPAGYDDHPQAAYPLLVMHDGQNVFDPTRAFVPGNHWRLAEAADRAIAARAARPMVIAAIDHGAERRIEEYTPTHDEEHEGGGGAPDHARMLLEELVPMLRSRFRIAEGPQSVAVGGSSLGGLVSLFVALSHPQQIGGAVVMSPSVWWDHRVILGHVDSFEASDRPRLWLDIGLREGTEAVADARELHARLRARGWDSSSLAYLEDRRGDHSEAAWAGRVERALAFLYPPVP